METIEMDLMQAQIGELATEVTRLAGKVAQGGGGNGRVIVIPTTNVVVGDDGSITANFDKTTYNIPELFDAGNLVIVSIKTNPDSVEEARIPINMKYSTSLLLGFTPYPANDQMTTAMLSASQNTGTVSVDFTTGA